MPGATLVENHSHTQRHFWFVVTRLIGYSGYSRDKPHPCGHYKRERIESEFDGRLSEDWRCSTHVPAAKVVDRALK